MKKKNNTKIVREANRYIILNIIRHKQRLTIDSIQSLSKLSYPTVNKIVNELLDQQIIIKDGFADSSGGKPPVYLKLNTNNYFALGIDVEIPIIRFQLSNLYCDAVYTHKAVIDGEANKKNVLDAILSGLDRCLQEIENPEEKIIGIGVGLPGIIDLKKNISIYIERIKDWRNVDLIKIIQGKYNIPVYIRNDVHLMAWVESKFKTDNDRSFALIAMRAGTGMSICIEGDVYEGLYGNAGFLGHTTVAVDGDLCKCGKKGCLDVYASKEAIVHNYQALPDAKKDADFSTILDLANNGDELAIKVLTDAGKLIGVAIANSIEIIDVNHFILSGISCNNDHIFLESIRKTVKENVIFASVEEIKIEISEYDNETYALGGCYFIVEHFFKKPYLLLTFRQ